MGFSEDDADVRVDFFKERGKWYSTEAVHWTGTYKGDPQQGGQLIWDAFIVSLADQLATLMPGADPSKPESYRIRYREMWAVCLHPCHEHSHPLMMRVPDDLILQAMAITGRPPKRYPCEQQNAAEEAEVEKAVQVLKSATSPHTVSQPVDIQRSYNIASSVDTFVDDEGAGGYIEHDWMVGGPLVSDDDPDGLDEEEELPENEHHLFLGRH